MPPPRIAAAFAGGAEEDEDEEDFMSDKFLQQAEDASKASKTDVTYSERRRKELAAATAKGRQSSRAEREREAREEGLRKHLLDDRSRNADAAAAGPENKALKMMMAMGYKTGGALGGPAHGEGVASRPSAPIALDSRWQGKARHGLGSAAVSRAIEAAADKRASHDAGIGGDIDDFRSRVASEKTLLHTEKLLSRARKTCEELDVKGGLEYSTLWIDTSWLAEDWEYGLEDHAKEILKDAFGGELGIVRGVSADEEASDKLARQEAKVRRALQSDANEAAIGESTDDPEEAPLGTARADEARRWCALPPADRLSITLGHLRDEHHYCLFCGCRYDDAEDLERSCPGLTEEDHD